MSTISTPTARRSATGDALSGGARVAGTAMKHRPADAPPAGTGRPEHGRPEPGRVRPFLRRWMTAGMLFAAAVLATLYIANAIAVDNLLVDITSLERERDLAQSENEKLRAELLRLMSVERVTTIAAQRLGLIQPAGPPRELTASATSTAPEGTQGNSNSGTSPEDASHSDATADGTSTGPASGDAAPR